MIKASPLKVDILDDDFDNKVIGAITREDADVISLVLNEPLYLDEGSIEQLHKILKDTLKDMNQ